MPGRIQSLERGAAVLSLLGGASPDLSLAEVADALGLPRPTTHGLLATLVHVGFVQQDEQTRRYRLGPGLTSLQQHGVDRHDLRSTATSWCDSLAARTRSEVLVCVRTGDAAEVVHHVFRPDGSEQHLRVGELLPLHATGVGRALLAASTTGHRALSGPLTAYTARTPTASARLAGLLDRARAAGFAAAPGEHVPEVGDVGAALRGVGGLPVGAVACTGHVDTLFGADGVARAEVAQAVTATAAAISRALVTPR